jgi:SAM-dependent methyltransferase
VSALTESLGRRVARLATDAVVRSPRLWRVFRGPVERQFDGLAPQWETRIGPHHLGALERALEEVPAPQCVLDVGSGTGVATFAVARRFPEAEVVGVDLSTAMVEHARAKTPPDLAVRVRFEVADASALPFEDGAFELVVLMNAIPFFDELERVTGPRAAIAASFSRGAETPIYVPEERLRREVARRGFSHFASFTVELATAFLAVRGDRA